jgi:hypothetical protein
MSIANFASATTAQTYRYVAQAGAQLTKGSDLTLSTSGPTALNLPAHSMTLIVVGKP